MATFYSGDNKAEVKHKKIKSEVFEWLDIAVTAIIVVVILLTVCFRVVNIEGESMQKTLNDKQKVIITNFMYTPKYGDIVIISRNADNTATKDAQKPLIKRVIATEGQTVDIDNDTHTVYVNGIALTEKYVFGYTEEFSKRGEVEFPVTVPKGHIFVMGDNRQNSLDSRFKSIGDNGMIDKRYVLGRAVYRIYPFKEFK